MNNGSSWYLEFELEKITSQDGPGLKFFPLVSLLKNLILLPDSSTGCIVELQKIKWHL